MQGNKAVGLERGVPGRTTHVRDELSGAGFRHLGQCYGVDDRRVRIVRKYIDHANLLMRISRERMTIW